MLNLSTSDWVQVGIAIGGGFGSLMSWLLWRLILNIVELNKNFAVVTTRVDSHEKRLDKIEGKE